MAARRLLACFLFVLVISGLAQAASSDRQLPVTLSIGLASSQRELKLRLPAGSAASSPAGRIWSTDTESLLTVSFMAEGSILGNGANLGRGPLRFTAPGLLGWGQKFYRGVLEITWTARGLNLVNQLNLEDYLRGVLPSEVNPKWPLETLKAQAVAARTYAVTRLGSHRLDGFDLCSTTHCQVYDGANGETQATDAAVAATEGQVLTCGGKLAAAYYHAASGGYTEDVENVWTTAAAASYLRGVSDPAEDSPYEQWRVNLGWPQLEEALAAKYPQIGRVVSVTIAERTAAGRAKLVEVIGDRSSLRLPGENFRSLFALRSTFFEVAIEYGAAPLPSRQSLAAAPVYHAFAPVAETIWPDLIADDWIFTPVRLSIEGRGWGHGVGLSQWGAKALAELGYTYIMILKYYYQGAEIEDWRPPQAAPALETPPAAAGGDVTG